MTKPTRLGRLIVTNIFLLILVFIIGEAVCRIAGIPYKTIWIPNENSFGRFDKDLGWSYMPGISSINVGGKGENILRIPVHFDENGIRVQQEGFQFDYSRPSILFIGCSITMGHGLFYEESFAGKLSNIKEFPYQVVNLGVQGYGSDQSLIALKKYINKFNTKIVVYTFFDYHLRRNSNYDRRQIISGANFLGTKPLFSLDAERNLHLIKKPRLYEDYDYSYSWLIDLFKISIGRKLGTFPPISIELTKAIIQEMNKISEENDAHFLVLDWRWSDKDKDDFLHELDIDIIDTLENAPPGWSDMVIFKGVHPTSQATDHATQLLLEYFRNKGLL
jgi:hypothetical protein